MIRFRVKRDELGQYSDEGSALVLALVFLTVVSVLIAAILSFADVSFRATTAIRDYDKIAYAVDGAIDAAINHYRTNGTAGVAGQPCPDFITSVNDISVTVSCEANTSTSGQSTVGTGPNLNNTPAYAILALGTAAPTGQQGVIQQASNSTLTVQGDVFSHYTIKAGTGIFNVVSGTATARDECSGSFTSPPVCNIGNTNPTAGQDPNYAATTTVTPFRAPPACPSSVTQTVIYEPGFYSSGKALSALTGSSCAGRVHWFKPGVYYFDFLDASASDRVWTINDPGLNNTGIPGTDIVGGTPKNWTPAPPGLVPAVVPIATPATPDVRACKSETDASPNDGVHFIFGGESRINLQAGRVQLCAQPSPTSQQIALYGGKTGGSLASLSKVSGTSTSAPTGAGQFDNHARTRVIDGSGSDAVLASQGSARVTITGFSPNIPSGALLARASMKVAHGDGPAIDRITATVTPATGAPITLVGTAGTCVATNTSLCVDSSNNLSIRTQTIDLVALGLDTAEEFSGVSVTFEAHSGTNDNAARRTERLDGIEMDFEYLTSRRAQDVGVDLVTTSSSLSNFLVEGTVYAPRADFDIQLPNHATQVFGRGIVARSLRINVPASQVSTAATIKIPSASPGGSSGDREVLLVARVSGTTRLRALVAYGDSPSLGQTVLIKKWSVVR